MNTSNNKSRRYVYLLSIVSISCIFIFESIEFAWSAPKFCLRQLSAADRDLERQIAGTVNEIRQLEESIAGNPEYFVVGRHEGFIGDSFEPGNIEETDPNPNYDAKQARRDSNRLADLYRKLAALRTEQTRITTQSVDINLTLSFI